MNEYELYTRILNPCFKVGCQTILKEEKQPKHKVSITSRGVDAYTLYRFDEEARDFLPFFSANLDGLRRFCDYVLLANIQAKLYVVLIELKSGQATGAGEQLEASTTFMDYIQASAERVKGKVDFQAFDKRNIKVRRIILKYVPSVRPNTKQKPYKTTEDPIVVKANTLSIRSICQS